MLQARDQAAMAVTEVSSTGRKRTSPARSMASRRQTLPGAIAP